MHVLFQAGIGLIISLIAKEKAYQGVDGVIVRGKTIIIGHRGAAGNAPENTLASFQLAVEQGADALELDIHVSADGELVVCHDASVDRTTNGDGEISGMTVEQLKSFDAGSWFAPQFAGQKLPLLQEVFELIPSSIMINVEIKCRYSPRLESRLLDLIKEYNRISGVVVSSFDHHTLVHLKRSEADLRIGLLYSANVTNHCQLAEMTGVEVYSLHPYYKLIDAEDIGHAIFSGLQVYPFTINHEEEIKQALEAGVSGIITDFPGRLKALIGSN
jgi:glycerophosphoryl diester phosphodiesterase